MVFLNEQQNQPCKDFDIPRFHFIDLIFFPVGNLRKLPLTFIAAASGGGAFLLIIVAAICFACFVRSRRLVSTVQIKTSLYGVLLCNVTAAMLVFLNKRTNFPYCCIL